MSDVYFIKIKEKAYKDRASSLSKLLSNIESLSHYKKGEFIPVKFTVGDSRCIYNLRPELIKIIIDWIKKKKAKPFLFDTNVIYSGERQNAIDHLNLIQNKGFGISKIGAPYIIADGLLGQDGKEYEIESSLIKRIKIPTFIGMLDNLLVLSHITGHILTGYAGALKNVAMGMACRSTKQTEHSSLKPHIIKDKCTACTYCIKVCPKEAIILRGNKVIINQKLCIGCGECICACRFNAIFINWDEEDDIFAKRMVEVAKFILSKFKNKLFINFAFDITKECDCISTKSEEIVAEDIGILASCDILSVDKATMDLIDKNSPHFRRLRPPSVFTKMFEYAEEIGLGSLKYNLITL
jgi:hypothetical protein